MQDETIKSRILGLLQKGYTRSQLINDFNFAKRTVDAAIKEYKQLRGDGDDETKTGETMVEVAKMDKETLVRVRDFCDAVLKMKYAGELAAIIHVKAQQFELTAEDLRKVSQLMFAVADEMREKGWKE